MKSRIHAPESVRVMTMITLGFLLASTAGFACVSQSPGRAFASSRLLSGALESPAMRARSWSEPSAQPENVPNPLIAGLWNVNLFVGNTQQIFDQGFDQWHSDGTEIFNDNAYPPSLGNVCLGVWQQTGPRTVKLRHPAWNFDASGNLTGSQVLLETLTLDPGGNQYAGTYSLDTFDLAGKLIPSLHAEGILSATRIVVDLTQPSSGGVSAVTIVVTGPGATSTTNTFETSANQISLDASQSSSTNAGALTYYWTVAPGYPVAAIAGVGTATPIIQLPSKGVYQFTLIVTDSQGVTATATITVRYD